VPNPPPARSQHTPTPPISKMSSPSSPQVSTIRVDTPHSEQTGSPSISSGGSVATDSTLVGGDELAAGEEMETDPLSDADRWVLRMVAEHDSSRTFHVFMIKVKLYYDGTIFRTAVKNTCTFPQFRAQVMAELRGDLDFLSHFTAKYSDEDDDLVNVYTTSSFKMLQASDVWNQTDSLK
jgi:hypothetical protein